MKEYFRLQDLLCVTHLYLPENTSGGHKAVAQGLSPDRIGSKTATHMTEVTNLFFNRHLDILASILVLDWDVCPTFNWSGQEVGGGFGLLDPIALHDLALLGEAQEPGPARLLLPVHGGGVDDVVVLEHRLFEFTLRSKHFLQRTGREEGRRGGGVEVGAASGKHAE